MNASVHWEGGLTFTGSADTGFTVPLGGPIGLGGDEDGFRPIELMAVSLAGCTAMDVISILRKKRQEVTGFDVTVEAERATEHPRVMTAAIVRYEIRGRGIKRAAVERAIELSAEGYCPAQAMLSQVMPIRLEYAIWEDAEDGGEATLVAREVWEPEAAGV